MRRSPITRSHFRFRLYSEATRRRSPRPSPSAHVLNMSPFTLRLRLARSPGTRRSLGGGGWRRSGDIYVLFLSNFVSPGQSRSRPTIWDFEAERRWAPRALMVITCPQACGGRAVEASSCALRDLRGTRTAWVTSTLILNTMQLAEQMFFLSLFFSELDTLSFF